MPIAPHVALDLPGVWTREWMQLIELIDSQARWRCDTSTRQINTLVSYVAGWMIKETGMTHTLLSLYVEELKFEFIFHS